MRNMIRYFFPLTILLFLLLTAGCSDDGGGIGNPDEWKIPTIPAYSTEFETMFAPDTVKVLYIQISEAEWNALLSDFDANDRNEICRKADFYYGSTNTTTAIKISNVGFRVRGNSFSRTRPESGTGVHNVANTLIRAHFKIKFNEQFDADESVYGGVSQNIPDIPLNKGREFNGVRALNLKFNNGDPTYIRETASYELFRRFGVQTPRATYARLYIKIGSDPIKYFGVYTMMENVDKAWVRRRYGSSGFLFKCLWQDDAADLADTDTDGDMASGKIGSEITDPLPAFRPAYDLKTKDTEALIGADHLNNFITLLQGTPTKQELLAILDVQSLLRAMAVNAAVGMSDDYWRNANNYYLVLNPRDNRWVFIPYDYDHTFGRNIGGFDDPATSSFTNWGAGGNSSINPVLINKVLAIPDFRNDFVRYVGALVDDTRDLLLWSKLGTHLQNLQDLISPWATGYDAYDSNPYAPISTQGIEAFVNSRVAVARYECGSNTIIIDTDGNTSYATAVSLATGETKDDTIYMATDTDFFRLTVASNANYVIELTNLAGDLSFEVYEYYLGNYYLAGSSDTSGTGNESVTTSLYASGTYYVKVKTGSGNGTGSYTVSFQPNPVQVSFTMGNGFTLITDHPDGWYFYSQPMYTDCTINVSITGGTGNEVAVLQKIDWYVTGQWQPVAIDPTPPYQFIVNDDSSDWQAYRVIATNSLGLSLTSLNSEYSFTHVASYTSPVNNGDGTYTFIVHPTNFTPSAAGHNIYFAGGSVGWAVSDYSLASGQQLTNMNDGTGRYCLQIAASSGQEYKFNIDYNDDGTRQDSTEWRTDPVNMYNKGDGNNNSIVP